MVTPAEREHLEWLAKDRIILRLRLDNLNLQYQATEAQLARADQALAAAGEDVRKAHAWPEATKFDIEQLAFTPPPARPEPAPAKDETKK